MKLKSMGAFVYIANSNGDVLFVRQNYGDRHWTMPGGGVEQGEDPRDAAVREVLEETGITIEVGDLIGTYVTIYRDDVVLQFEGNAKKFDLNLPNDEIAELGFFSPSSLPEPFSPNARVRLQDALEKKRGVLRIFESVGVVKS